MSQEELTTDEILSSLRDNEESQEGTEMKTRKGRPFGSTNAIKFRKVLREYVTEVEAKHMVDRAKKLAKTDKRILMFLLEQMFGKARQNVGLDGGSPGAPITMAALLDQLEKPKKAIKTGENTYIT